MEKINYPKLEFTKLKNKFKGKFEKNIICDDIEYNIKFSPRKSENGEEFLNLSFGVVDKETGFVLYKVKTNKGFAVFKKVANEIFDMIKQNKDIYSSFSKIKIGCSDYKYDLKKNEIWGETRKTLDPMELKSILEGFKLQESKDEILIKDNKVISRKKNGLVETTELDNLIDILLYNPKELAKDFDFLLGPLLNHIFKKINIKKVPKKYQEYIEKDNYLQKKKKNNEKSVAKQKFILYKRAISSVLKQRDLGFEIKIDYDEENNVISIYLK